MPWQLIYTSAPRGLVSGQSGFCTVARSEDLREALAQRLEQLSSYNYLRVAEATTAGRNPTVHAFRLLDLRGTKYAVLTRIHPCGLDFTARTNHLAHHLIFHAHELAQLPSPAAILRDWPGWLNAWQGEPRLLPDVPLTAFAAAAKYALPATHWLRLTGDAGRAAALLDSDQTRHVYLLCPPDSEQQMLDLYCESLQLLNFNGQFALRPWRHTFTTFLQGEDNPADFQWRACQEGTPGQQQALQRSMPLLSIARLRVPSNSLVKIAREGQRPVAPAPASAGAAPSGLTLKIPEKSIPLPPPLAQDDPWKDFDDSTATRKPRFYFDGISPKAIGVGVFIIALVALILIKSFLPKRHPAAPHPASTSPAPVVTPLSASETAPNSALPVAVETAPPTDELKILSGDGPVYIYPVNDFNTISLPIETNLRLQKLLNRFDKLETLPAAIQLSVNTDSWDFSSGAPATVASRQGQMLSAQIAAGLSFSLDYSAWKADEHAPLSFHASFAIQPKALSLHFGLSNSREGDPFRLLFVNQTDGPAPLSLNLRWLRPEAGSLTGSLQAPLGEQLGNFIIPGDCRWQLRPFAHVPQRNEIRYVYKNWSADDLPAAGDELGFAGARQRIATRLTSLRGNLASITAKLDEQLQKAIVSLSLGEKLGVTNANLLSLGIYAPKPTGSDFIAYLNALRKQTHLNGWPRVAEDDEDAEVTAKFEQILDSCLIKTPELKRILVSGNTNYFTSTWQALKEADATRKEMAQATAEVDKTQGQLTVIPETLDKVAYVGLYLVAPGWTGLEMIRFEEPRPAAP